MAGEGDYYSLNGTRSFTLMLLHFFYRLNDLLCEELLFETGKHYITVDDIITRYSAEDNGKYFSNAGS